jgi:L-alanine-DL-glutamate epimerase-like enolase superfamily enzyme
METHHGGTLVKITDVRPVLFSNGMRNTMVVVVETDDGFVGYGEPGVSSQLEAISKAVETLRPRLIGEDATRIEHHWQVMFRGGFFPGGNILSSAVSAIDIALWDLNAKALGVPVYRLLGGRVRDKVPCYCHIGGHALEGLTDSAKAAVDEGWRFIRWGSPEQGQRHEPTVVIRESIAGMEALRKTVGEDIEICFDVHARLDPADAIALARGIAPTRPYFLEDPIRSENVQVFRHLRQHIDIPIAAGEHYASKWEIRQLIEEDLIDFCRADLCIIGGLTESRKVANWCETHYIRMVTHNPLGPVSSAACMHLNLALTNVGVQEQPRRPGTSLTQFFPVQIGWEDGYLVPNDSPGLGIVFDEKAALASPPLPPGRGRLLRRDDGAITNW